MRQRATVLLLIIGTAASKIARAPIVPNLRTYTAGCKTLAYEEYGAGQPIVLLAGGPGENPAYMDPVARMLASAGRRVLLLEQRGTGRSADAISCRERMTLAGAVADLDALRVHLRLERLTIAGHSWGGMLAMAYAQKHPDRVAALLLIDPGPMTFADFPKESAVVHARLTGAQRMALQDAKGEAQIEAAERPAFFYNAGNARRLEESIPTGEPLWYESVGALLGPDLGKFDVVEEMRKLKAPVTLVFGRLDPGFFISAELQVLKPGARLFVVEDAGHYPWLEDSVRTATVLKEAVSTRP
jgi:proline iminopeptidase